MEVPQVNTEELVVVSWMDIQRAEVNLVTSYRAVLGKGLIMPC
jgi:hypothetical protein